MDVKKYLAWHVDVENFSAKYGHNGSTIQVRLLPTGNGIFGEGWWPVRPSTPPTSMITGVCLWDGRWRVKFKKRSSGNPGATRVLAYPLERADAYLKLEKGHELESISIPSAPGPYHEKMVAWIGHKARELEVKEVFCHVPLLEYVHYIKTLEEKMGQKLPQLHRALQPFAHQIFDALKKQLKGTPAKIHFLNPMQLGAETPEESYLWPYLYPERFGISTENLVGCEDMMELKILLKAREVGNSPVKAVYGCILGLPHPYTIEQGPSTTFQP